MTNYYTADPHFGHDRMISVHGRPFADTAEMDTAILRNMTAVVGDEDDLWILGDLSCGPRARDPAYLAGVFERLPGRRHLVRGNHDGDAVLDLPWDSIHEIAEIRDGTHHVVLCHYPMVTWNGARRGAVQLFGHVHDIWAGSHRSINVGVDLWDFRPVALDTVFKRARGLPRGAYDCVVAETSHPEVPA